ncbi:hypothetical protein HPP92_018114 [Vanilla planifolia]|uniref:PWWP domain-containing protein n=1 Tax=Vanilla planifolia TaxID=51239 RepID=A0A835Q6G8_VANPL|nr:hypothetical protein HPP92_018114 [Vanilla planifolia]
MTGGGSSMHVTLEKLQNVGAELTFDVNSCQDSSSVMISSSAEVEHAIGTDSVGGILVEKADTIDENFNSSLGMMSNFASESQNPSVLFQGNEPSAASTVLQPSTAFIGHELVMESETDQVFTASEFSVSAVCKNIDGTKSMHSGKLDTLKETENQIEESSDSRTGFTSTSQQATYYLSVPLKEGFSTSDLVWGKVKSHPWWPGQIIDLSGASELALKYQKKDHFLVAYFGDKTFAWCEETHLKPFQLHFQQMEKQSNSESFLRAISDILVEISRRIELAMACFCLLGETPAEVKYQKLENAGVRGKTVNSVINRVEIVTYFHPDRLLDYIKTLALLPTGGADRLELVVAQGQLKSFYRSKGYTDLPVFTNGSGLVENDFEAPLSTREKPYEDDLENSATLSDLFSTKVKPKGRDLVIGKQKHIVEDGRKQKCLSDLMEEDTPVLLENGGGTIYGLVGDGGCISSDKKRKFVDSCSIDIWGSKTKKLDTQLDKDNKMSPANSTVSFKVGEFISRAASKLTSLQTD